MPSPFSSKKEPQTKDTVVDAIKVSNSVLVCEVCFEETDEGIYYPERKRLEFRCKHGHVNVVKDIEI